MNCKKCNCHCIKKGFNKTTQKYYCKSCKLYQQKKYVYRICSAVDKNTISKLTCIGVSISGISKFTGISKSHIINLIKEIAQKITIHLPNEVGQEYEMDELRSFIKHKSNLSYLTYAINKQSRQVIDFVIGSRTKENLNKVVQKINSLKPKRIFTDKLNIYPTLISSAIHRPSAYKINHIERFNLTLRTHIKRLSRKTICFSKSAYMFECVLKIYFHNLALCRTTI